ncbi:MAG: carboxypeptidase regulatory-like domain-containing protein [Elusimicrobia bacterium]|nr:carboxypeptidase regulatory-like domain-containing protein [Elusimicrobiota bacterium]
MPIKKVFSFFTFFTFFTFPLWALKFISTNTIDSVYEEFPQDLFVENVTNPNVYMVGYSTTSTDKAVKIWKKDSSVDIATFTIDNPSDDDFAFGIIKDYNGDLRIGGYSCPTAGGDCRAKLWKMTPSGTNVSAGSVGIGGKSLFIKSVAAESGGGGVWAAGFVQNGAMDDDVKIWRFNSAGEAISTTTIGNTGADKEDRAEDIAYDGYNSYVWVVGYSSNGITGKDFTLWRLNTSGTVLSSTTINNGPLDFGRGVAVDPWGNVWAVGDFYNGSNYDIKVFKFNSSGQLIQTTVIDKGGDDFSDDLTVENSSTVWVVGRTLTSDLDVAIWKIHSSGQILSTTTIDNAGSNTDVGTGIGFDIDGNIWAAGYYYPPASQDNKARLWRFEEPPIKLVIDGPALIVVGECRWVTIFARDNADVDRKIGSSPKYINLSDPGDDANDGNFYYPTCNPADQITIATMSAFSMSAGFFYKKLSSDNSISLQAVDPSSPPPPALTTANKPIQVFVTPAIESPNLSTYTYRPQIFGKTCQSCSQARVRIVRSSDSYAWDGANFTSYTNWLNANITGIDWNYPDYQNVALQNGTSYFVEMQEYAGASWSGSTFSIVFTYSAGGSANDPAPSNVMVTGVTTGTISASWTAGSASSYVAVLANDGAFTSIYSSGTTPVAAGATTYFNLAADSTYYFRVKNSTHTDASYSNPISTKTAKIPPPPSVENVQFTAVSSNSLTVSWNVISGNSYVAYLSNVPDFTTTVSFATLALDQGATTYSNLASNNNYYFKVRISTHPDASYSNPISTTTLPPSGVDQPPSNVRFDTVYTSSLTVKWDGLPGVLYLAALARDAAFADIVSSYTLSSAGASSQTYTTLLDNRDHLFKIKISTHPDSLYSASITTRTKSLGGGNDPTITSPAPGASYTSPPSLNGTAPSAYFVQIRVERADEFRWDPNDSVFKSTTGWFSAGIGPNWTYGLAVDYTLGQNFHLDVRSANDIAFISTANVISVNFTFTGSTTSAPSAPTIAEPAALGVYSVPPQINGTASDGSVQIKIIRQSDGAGWDPYKTPSDFIATPPWLAAGGAPSWSYNNTQPSYSNGNTYRVEAQRWDSAAARWSSIAVASFTFSAAATSTSSIPSGAIAYPVNNQVISILSTISGTASNNTSNVALVLKQFDPPGNFWSAAGFTATNPVFVYASQTSSGSWANWSWSAGAPTTSNLLPGTTYQLEIKLYDSANAVYPGPITNFYFTGTGGTGGGGGGGNAEGFMAASPSTILTGNINTTTFTYTVTAGTFAANGAIRLVLPSGFWASIGASQADDAGYYNEVFAFSTITALNVTANQDYTSNQTHVTVSAGQSFFKGQKINIALQDYYGPCFSQGATFYALVDSAGAGNFLPLPTTAQAQINFTGGTANWLSLPYGATLLANTTAPLVIEARDSCSNPASLAGSVAIVATGTQLNTQTWFYETDSAVSMADNSSMTGAANPLSFSIDNTNRTLYVKSASSGTKHIQLSYNLNGYPSYSSAQLNILASGGAGGISGEKLRTNSSSATAAQVTITPDGDGVDDMAFIDFNLGDPNIGWTVKIATLAFSNPASSQAVVWSFSGWGQPYQGQIMWGGYPNIGGNFGLQPQGTYYIQIALSGDLIKKETLSIFLSSLEIRGTVQDFGANPLEGVMVNAYGPSSRFTMTDAKGKYVLSGLKAGSYSVQFMKYGVPPESRSANAGDTLNVTLASAGKLRVNITRNAGAYLPEFMGSISIENSLAVASQTLGNNFFGSFHFQVNASTSDNGIYPFNYSNNNTDPWQAGKWSVFNIAQGTYTITLKSFSYGSDTGILVTSTVFVGGTNKDVILPLPSRSNLLVNFSVPAAPKFDQWVSLEAGLDSEPNGSYDSGFPSFWAGSMISSGSLSASATFFGLNNGTYLVKARVPGFAPTQDNATIAGSDASLMLPAFGSGRGIDGTVTIAADPALLAGGWRPEFFGNAWSPQSYDYGSIFLSTNAAWTVSGGNASANFTINGLSAGQKYQVFGHVPGEFDSATPMPVLVSVPSSGNGSVALTFQRFTGSIAGNVVVPGADYANAKIVLTGIQTARSVENVAVPSAGAFVFNGLGTGLYQLEAIYAGRRIKKSLQVTQGAQTAAGTLDLTQINTYSISGRFNLSVVSPPAAPFNSISAIISSAVALANFAIPDFGAAVPATANLVVAFPQDFRDFGQGRGGLGFGAIGLVSTDIRLGFISNQGTFTISGLVPGNYVLQTFDLDLSTSTAGPEILGQRKAVAIVDRNITNADFEFGRGFSIAGNLELEAGLPNDSRQFQVALRNPKEGFFRLTPMLAMGDQATGLTGNSARYEFFGIPAGEYVIKLEDLGWPKKYIARPLRITVAASSLSNQNITVVQAGAIRGKLRDKDSGRLFTSLNNSSLPSNLRVYARANPWIEGGLLSSGRQPDAGEQAAQLGSGLSSLDNVGRPTLDDLGYFQIPGALPGVTYDVYVAQETYSAQEEAKGAKNYAPFTKSGIKVDAGQTVDLGILDLRAGLTVSGTIKDDQGAPLVNIPIIARPSSNSRAEGIVAWSQADGKYQVVGLDPNEKYYDFTVAPKDKLAKLELLSKVPYAQLRKSAVDITSYGQGSVALDFTLASAQGGVFGKVVSSDGGAFGFPFGDQAGFPAAAIAIKKAGDQSTDNPFGDIIIPTAPDGTFVIDGIAAGKYEIRALSSGYAPTLKTVTVGSTGQIDAGIITLNRGALLTGKIAKNDGGAVSGQEAFKIVAMDQNLTTPLIGTLVMDPNTKNIEKYEIAGFAINLNYNLGVLGEEGDFALLASGISFSSATEQRTLDLTFNPDKPSVFGRSKKSDSSIMNLRFRFTQPLRNSTEADNNLSSIISTTTGSGTLSNFALSPNRRSLTCDYSGFIANESSFTIRAKTFFSRKNPKTGSDYEINESLGFFVGLAAHQKAKVSNLTGGTLSLEGDSTSVDLPAGAIQVSTSTIDVTLSKAASLQTTAGYSSLGGSPGAPNVNPSAYPEGLYQALAAQPPNVSAMSAFYEILLPRGIASQLNKYATLTIQYDTGTVTNPYGLNVYWYNEAAKNYVLVQNNINGGNPVIDTENGTISVGTPHFSVFVVLANDLALIEGSAYTGGEIEAFNFPNPFDLKQKTLSLSRGGSATSMTTKGTVVRFSLPPAVGGSASLEIFNVAGELVRTIKLGDRNGGLTHYVDWDGKNESGTDVASGVYIGLLRVGSHKKFFKMAVVK